MSIPPRSWKHHAWRLLFACILVLLFGWLTGFPVRTALIAVAAYACWHIGNVWRLYRWLQNTEAGVPESYGIWADIFDGISTLERQKQRQRERYQSAIGEFQSLTDAFPDATLVVDANDSITWFNTAARKLLGLKAPEDLGQAVTHLLRGPDFANWLAVQSEVKSPLEMPSPKDDATWLNINAVAYRKGQRLLILRDISDVHNVDKIRHDFVANISHELRTPLTVLLGYLEMLQQNPSDGHADAIERMHSQALKMQDLLADLLELSRLQNDEMHHQEKEVDVPALLILLQKQVEEISKNRHELHFHVNNDLCLCGIASDLESVFRNLIVNAVNYTPEGGRIEVGWRKSEDGAVFSVKDNGIGIPRRDIPRLTERFYRVGSDRARHTGGTGLGLAIVKHVLNAHQARLVIESELGEGSEFICRFPADRLRKKRDKVVANSS